MAAPQGKALAVVVPRCEFSCRASARRLSQHCSAASFPVAVFILIKKVSRSDRGRLTTTQTKNGIKFELSRHIDMMLTMPLFNRPFCLLCSYLLLGALSLQAVPNYTEYARLLETYVADDGVRYAAWVQNQADIDALDAVLESFDLTQLDELSRDAQKAFYINLYNAAMVQAVLDHYPLKSVKGIGFLPFSIFNKKYISLGGIDVSLNHVEKSVLLQRYFDPRIHFAVNCASESCPPLRAEPFWGERLDEQLDEQTGLFAASDRAARVNAKSGAIAYSELFKWYVDDFDVKTPAVFLNRYRAFELSEDAAVAWIDYDWSLNASKN